MELDSFVFTSTGGREYNEDSAGKQEAGDSGLYVVADGLGGHLQGELASALAVETILKAWTETGAPKDRLTQAIAQANEAILALQKEKCSNMKTTAVSLLISDGSAAWAHVGDSRLYRFHQGQLASVTEDHSVAYKKYKAGEITRAQIATDEDQSSLLRTLGNPTRNQPVLGEAAVCPGDGFLLCTDGLWEYLHDQEILADLLKTETARQWAGQLLLRVMARSQPGNDNMTLITLRIR